MVRSWSDCRVRYTVVMSLFGSNLPKRVTKDEWSKIRSNLYGKLDERELGQLEMLFRGDLDEPGQESGITQAEYDAAMLWLRENPKKHDLEPADLELVEKYFAEHLQD